MWTVSAAHAERDILAGICGAALAVVLLDFRNRKRNNNTKSNKAIKVEAPERKQRKLKLRDDGEHAEVSFFFLLSSPPRLYAQNVDEEVTYYVEQRIRPTRALPE